MEVEVNDTVRTAVVAWLDSCEPNRQPIVRRRRERPAELHGTTGAARSALLRSLRRPVQPKLVVA